MSARSMFLKELSGTLRCVPQAMLSHELVSFGEFFGLYHFLKVTLTLRKESNAPFSINSVIIITGRLLVTTPSSRMMFG